MKKIHNTKLLCFLFVLALNAEVHSQFWFECNTGITTELTSCSNSMPGIYWRGWACGINGTIIRSTTNMYGQWTNITGHGVPLTVNLNNICAVDSQTALVCGSQGSNTSVWKTTNGGQNWFQVFTQINGFINAVWMKNYLRGFMVGNPVNGRWSIWKTTNGGINWDSTGLYLPQSGNEHGWQNSLCIPLAYPNQYSEIDSNKIWFGTNNYRIYYSSNYGQNWTSQPTSPEQNSYCIAYGMTYPNPPMLRAGGSNFLLKTTNYGMNWTTDSIGGNGNIVGVTLCWYAWYAARGNKIYSNSGGNWYLSSTAPSGNYTYIDNRGFGMWVDHYAVRNNGGINFGTEGEGIQKILSEIPNKFSLYQNYPNPFNPVTKIQFSVPSSQFVVITIFDVTGREVATLVKAQLQPGTYEVEWDATNFPSGVYFYRIAIHSDKLTSGDFTDTKKMILLK